MQVAGICHAGECLKLSSSSGRLGKPLDLHNSNSLKRACWPLFYFFYGQGGNSTLLRRKSNDIRINLGLTNIAVL